MEEREKAGWIRLGEPCPDCMTEGQYYYRIHEDDEGHSDVKYKCFACGNIHWIDGMDA